MKVKSTSPKLDTTLTEEMPEFKLLLLGGAEATADFMSGFQLSCEKKNDVPLELRSIPMFFIPTEVQ